MSYVCTQLDMFCNWYFIKFKTVTVGPMHRKMSQFITEYVPGHPYGTPKCTSAKNINVHTSGNDGCVHMHERQAVQSCAGSSLL